MSHILLTRSSKENELTSKKLESLGFSTISLPMLSYLDEEINYEEIAYYKHIIITSKYAARLISERYQHFAECWVVGKESAKILSENPNIRITGIAKNTEELLSIISMVPEEESEDFFKSTIYLSGDIITTPLPKFIKNLIIYRVFYTDLISKHQIDMISKEKIKYILVYSKNCAINLIKMIEKYGLFHYFRKSTVIAISKEVADVFDDSKIKAIYSREPVFEDMLKLLI